MYHSWGGSGQQGERKEEEGKEEGRKEVKEMDKGRKEEVGEGRK